MINLKNSICNIIAFSNFLIHWVEQNIFCYCKISKCSVHEKSKIEKQLLVSLNAKKTKKRRAREKRILIRLSFHVRTTLLLFPSFWNRSKGKRELPHRASITAKLEATFSRIPLNFFPVASVSFDYRENELSFLSTFPFTPTHRHFFSMNVSVFSFLLFFLSPFLSCQLFFLHIVIAQACRLWRPLSRISGASFETSLFLETFSFVKLEFAFPPARRRRSPEALSLSNATSPRLRRDNGSKDHTQPLLDLKFRCCCPPKEHRPTGHVEKSRRDAIVTKPLPCKDQTTNRDTSRSFPSVSHRDLSEPVYFRRIKYHCTNRWGKRWVF